MTVKNFATAAKRKTGRKRKDIPFTIGNDPTEYHVRGEVKGDALTAISAEFVAGQGTENAAAMGEAIFDMLKTLFTDETSTALRRKLKNPDDTFTWEDLGEVIEWGIEQHSGGRPTTSQ